MKTTFKQFLDEGINDKGILKAIFVVGIPGSGKSYTVSKLKGTISPQVINTDRATEFLSKKLKVDASQENWPMFKDSAHRITTSQLFNYLNGLLPLFIDGTSSDVSNILARAGILESLGYDIGVVYVSTSLDVALDRAKKREQDIGREVSVDFIKKVHEMSEANKEYLHGKFGFFKEVSNDPGELTDEVMLDLFTKVSGFYNEPLKNPIGKRTVEKLANAKQKYLTPSIFEPDALKKKTEGWYRS